MIPLRDDNPSSSRPIVTYLLILASVLAFLNAINRVVEGSGQMLDEHRDAV